MCLLNAEKESCAPNSHLSVAGKEFGAQNSYLSSAEREFVAPNSYLSNADKEFCAPNLYLLSAEKEFVAPNSYLSNAGKEFVAPNSCLLTAERKFCAPNAHLSGYESPSATALRGLGAAAPSGAGEGGRFGVRKTPLPSRGGSSLQEFARFQAGRYPTARKKPPNFAALTCGKPRGFPAKGKPLEMFEDTVRACVLCSVFCVLCSVFNYGGGIAHVKGFCEKKMFFCSVCRRSACHGKSVTDWRGCVNVSDRSFVARSVCPADRRFRRSVVYCPR